MSPRPTIRARTLYFAYGSNLNPSRMKDRVGSYQNRLAARTQRGYILSFNKNSGRTGEGYATIQKGDNIVEGAVYEVSDEQIRVLDKFEGVPSHYKREEISLEVKSGLGGEWTRENAWVYYATKPSRKDLRPSWEYLSHLLAGQDLLSFSSFDRLQWWPTIQPCTFFVYGSLRPDDDTGMPWTRNFADKTISKPATLSCARLYEDSYACVVLGRGAQTDAPIGTLDPDVTQEDQVQGYAVRPRVDKVSLSSLLKEADSIEGYPSLYKRNVVTIKLDNGQEMDAFVYHRPECEKDKHIPSGNWLER